MAVGLDGSGQKVVGIGFITDQKKQKSVQTVHVYDGGDGVSIFEASEVHQNVEALVSLEVSIEGDVFFLGGAEKAQYEKGDAYIFALKFDESAETVRYRRYGDDVGLHCVTSMRRHPEGNVLFLGGFEYLAVVLWADSKFFLVNRIKNFAKNPITDICYFRNSVYSVCGLEKGMACDFGSGEFGGERVELESLAGVLTNTRGTNSVSGALSPMRPIGEVVGGGKNFFGKNENVGKFVKDNGDFGNYDLLRKSGVTGNGNVFSQEKPKRVERALFNANVEDSELANSNIESRKKLATSSLRNSTTLNLMRNSSMISTSSYKAIFEKFKLRQISLPGVELQRIQVSKDGNFIYTGKQGIRILQKIKGKYGLLKKGAKLPKFIDIKVTNERELLLFEEETSDLVKFDKNFNEISRLKGENKLKLGGSEIVTTLYSEDELLYIWLKGDNSIGIVNPRNMKYDTISNFFGPDPAGSVTPFTVIASQFEHKIVGLYVQENDLMVVLVRNGSEFVRKGQKDILDESKNFFP